MHLPTDTKIYELLVKMIDLKEGRDKKLMWENEAQSLVLISHLTGVGRDYQLQTIDIHTTIRMRWIVKFQYLEVSCFKPEGKESNMYLFY